MSACMLWLLISAESVIGWMSATVPTACLNNDSVSEKLKVCAEISGGKQHAGCVFLPAFFPLTLHRINRSESNSQSATFDLSSTLQPQTDSYLESSAPQNTGVIHDSVRSPVCFGFFKFRHFPGGWTTQRKSHYSLLAASFFVNKRPWHRTLSFLYFRDCPIFKTALCSFGGL